MWALVSGAGYVWWTCVSALYALLSVNMFAPQRRGSWNTLVASLLGAMLSMEFAVYHAAVIALHLIVAAALRGSVTALVDWRAEPVFSACTLLLLASALAFAVNYVYFGWLCTRATLAAALDAGFERYRKSAAAAGTSAAAGAVGGASALPTRAAIDARLHAPMSGADVAQLVWPYAYLTRHPDVQRSRNIVYHTVDRSATGQRNLQLRLDVFRHWSLPRHRPCLLWVHGGAWKTGNKDVHGVWLLQQIAAKAGWTVVSANYRLAPRFQFPACLIDAKRAVQWIKANAQQHGIDPDHIFCAGGSAGGHLASLLALTANDPTYQPGFEQCDTRIAGCVSCFGVMDVSRYGPKPTTAPLVTPDEEREFREADRLAQARGSPTGAASVAAAVRDAEAEAEAQAEAEDADDCDEPHPPYASHDNHHRLIHFWERVVYRKPYAPNLYRAASPLHRITSASGRGGNTLNGNRSGNSAQQQLQQQSPLARAESDPPAGAAVDPLDPNGPPPFLVLHGDLDNLVDPRQSAHFVHRFQRLAPQQLCAFALIPGAGHFFESVATLRNLMVARAVTLWLDAVYHLRLHQRQLQPQSLPPFGPKAAAAAAAANALPTLSAAAFDAEPLLAGGVPVVTPSPVRGNGHTDATESKTD